MIAAKKILKNLFSLSAAQIISKIIGLFTTAYLARVIRPQGFGMIGFAAAFVSYFSLMVNLGFDTLGVRETARNKDNIVKYVNNTITIRLLMATIGYALLAGVVSVLDKPLLVKNILYITGLGLFASAFFLNWVFQGIERMEIIAICQIFTSLLSLAGILLLVHNPDDVLWAVTAIVVSNAVNTFLMCAIYIKSFGKISLSFDAAIWKKMFAAALPMGFSAFMIAIYYNMDMVMLGFMRTETEVGYYSAAYKVLLLSLIPAGIILNVFFPQLSIANGNFSRMKFLMQKYSAAMFIVGAFLSVMGIAFADQIVNIIFGYGFRQSIFLLQILMIDTIFVYVNMTYGNPLLAWDRETFYMYAIMAGGFGNVILNLLLIPHYGATGAAIATVLSEVIVLGGVSHFHFKVSQSLYLVILIKILAIALISLMIAHLMRSFGIDFIITSFSTVFGFCCFNLIFRTVNLRELKSFFI